MRKCDHSCCLQKPGEVSEVWALVWWTSEDFLSAFFD